MLRQIVKDLLAQAQADPMQYKRIKLKKGLTIMIRYERTAYTLILARQDQRPSEAEWKTVCKHWSYPIAEPNFESGFQKGQYYLKGRVLSQRAFA